MPEITITPDASNALVARWLADFLAPRLASGDVTVNFPGGASPFPIMAELAKCGLDLTRLVVWPGDDRLVPEDHPASNTGRIRAELQPLGVRIVPLTEGATPPRFALTWLGMGDDGHIASLFPNTDPRADDPQPVRRLTPDPLPPEAPFDRLTLTIPALIACEQMLFVIRGPHRAALFAAAASGENDLPVARVLAAAHQPVTCFILS